MARKNYMKDLLITTLEGAEDFCVEECEKYVEAAESITSGRVLVHTENISLYLEHAQLAIYVIEIIERFDLTSIEDITARKISGMYHDVKCERTGEHNFSSNDVRRHFLNLINKEAKEILYVDITNKSCTIGTLLTPKKLSSRKYHMRINPRSVPPTIAAIALYASKYNAEKSLGDPFCRDGVILIEAGLFGGKELYGADMANNIRNARINAQVANTAIEFSEGSFDLLPPTHQVITRPFEFFVRFPESKVQQQLELFFASMKQKKIPKITLIMSSNGPIEAIAKESKYDLVSSYLIPSGQLQWKILSFAIPPRK